MNPKRFWAIVKKEFLQLKRDKPSMAIALIMPVMMLLLFGYAVSTDVDHIATAYLDLSRTPESRELLAKFTASNYFNLDYPVNTTAELNSLFKKGKIKAGLIIPPDYAEKLSRGQIPEVKYIVDGSDPSIARPALSSGVLVGQNYTREILAKKYPQIASTSISLIRPEVRYNPKIRSQIFTIPGLIGLVMQNLTVLLTAFALVREKERGTIEQLIVTPVTSFELILGKLVPYVLIGFLSFTIAFYFGINWFSVPMQGDTLTLFALALCFVAVALAIGILISTVARTQLQAMQMTIVFLLPSILLSGFMFPREAMPKIIQYLGYAIPLTYFLEILRGIIIRGAGLLELQNQAIALTVLGVFLLVVASLRFKKRLE
ncbi:ABC transporter permease [Carboxydothermus hydrogenoformans]|uniref:ABC transporter, permease protein n=1 Tax=Carboxydothermus hydrogenoformans (strain ATCC BAA-161 / DSM 6008 / Z-2901) TaxID=246194 RepID=Q3ADR2_CARHZ|nr:ABC transporter permease [Carboxydothermus hydrogenoformans]ABB15414.1 ABC transporter, permease protein [Carboxydothermus hydrogenoformans Z-2901]